MGIKFEPIDWGSINGIEALGLLLSLIGVVLGIVPIWLSKRMAEATLREACLNLKILLEARLNTPALMTVSSIRGLAEAVKNRTRSPVITDAAIAGVIRDLALDQETRLRPGKRLVDRLKCLDELLNRFDPSGPRLLSVSSVDRVRAYVQSILATSLAALAIQVWIAQSSLSSSIAAIALWLLNIIHVWVFIGAIRAWRFWRRQGAGKVNIVLDFFLSRALSQGHNVHLLWAPIWEEVFFGFILGVAVPYLVISALPLVSRWLSPETNRFVDGLPFRFRLVIFLTCGIISSWYFSSSHRLSYFEARRLRRRLEMIERNQELARLGHREFSEEEWAEGVRVCTRLWVLTGNPAYRSFERRRERRSELDIR
jgi:hypothetical protein